MCLTAVITGLICISGTIDNAFDLANPLAGERAEGSLSSFEAYRATRERRAPATDERQAVDTLSEEMLRVRYEALRADRLAQRTFRAKKGLVTSLILLAVAAVLFTTHWRWLRRAPAEPQS
ncbi:MAG: hypothetical protein ACREME_12440 [Gemmatimonadales bacterium]